METEATTARTLMVLTEYAEELEQKTKELRAIIHALAGRHGLSVEQPSDVRFPIRVRIPRNRPQLTDNQVRSTACWLIRS